MATILGTRFVFVDPTLAATSAHVTRRLHRPTPYPGNPLILGGDFCDREKLAESADADGPDIDQHAYIRDHRTHAGSHPWLKAALLGRCGHIQSVIRSPITGTLQMYYLTIGGLNFTDIGITGGTFVTCYAESDDGFHWTLPDLDRIELFGDTHNNLMFDPPSMAYVRVDRHHPDAARRYIAFVHHGPRIYLSPDGQQWSPPIDAHLQTELGRSDGDTFFGWSPLDKKYVAYFRPWREHADDPPDKPFFRRIARAVSDDLEHWYDHRTILSADDLDGPVAQLERMVVFPYEGFYLGLVGVMNNFPEERHTVSHMIGSLHQELCFSHDGVQWHRFPERDPFLSAVPGRPCYGLTVTADAPVEVGDELLFYYSSTPQAHGHLPNSGLFHVAKLLRDRFVGFAADDREGWVTTRPFVCPGGSLHVNADVRCGSLRVAAVLADGAHSLEHAAYRCHRVFGEQPFHHVRWQRTDCLENLQGQTITLKFYLHDAELFSFWFEQP